MRILCVLFIVLIALRSAAAQQSIPIETSILAAKFNHAGDRLYTVLEDRIQEIRTDDGAVVREFMIPGADSVPQTSIGWGTFGLTPDEHELVLIRPDSRILILDLEAGANPNGMWQTIGVPRDPADRAFSSSTIAMSFYGSLGDGKLVFARGNMQIRRCLTLMLYDRNSNAFLGQPVELERNVALSLCPSEESVSAIRLTMIGKSPRYFWQHVPNKMERLKIQWNDLGYGSVSVEAEGYLPDAPVSISPDLRNYTSESGELQSPNSNTGWLISSIGNVQWHTNPTPQHGVLPKPIHRTFFRALHGGTVAVRWSGNSERLFIGGSDYSPKPSLSGVTVYSRTGQRIAMLPTGRARFVYLPAVSHDGKRVVTSAGKKSPESTLLWLLD